MTKATSKYLTLSLRCANAQLAAIEAHFDSLCPSAISFRDGNPMRTEPALDGHWEVVQAQAWLSANVNAENVRRELEALGGFDVRTEFVDAAAWSKQTQPSQPHLRIGPFLIGSNLAKADPACIKLELTPGLAFGTGEHETTAMCLTWLAEQSLAGKRVLDFGCGSGILAIAANKLGASEVHGVDNDPIAIDVAAANAQRNGATLTLEPKLPQVPPFDAVVANILADTLIAFAPQIERALKPCGSLALSGILESQTTEVQKAYPNIAFEPPQCQNGWVLLTGKLKP